MNRSLQGAATPTALLPAPISPIPVCSRQVPVTATGSPVFFAPNTTAQILDCFALTRVPVARARGCTPLLLHAGRWEVRIRNGQVAVNDVEAVEPTRVLRCWRGAKEGQLRVAGTSVHVAVLRHHTGHTAVNGILWTSSVWGCDIC